MFEAWASPKMVTDTKVFYVSRISNKLESGA